jgi:hypothetical protein
MANGAPGGLPNWETTAAASRDAIEFAASEWDCDFMVGFLWGNIDETSDPFEGRARVHAD